MLTQANFLDKAQPTKKPKNGELTKEQKEENHHISSSRVIAEHPISHVKNFAVVGGIFRGNQEDIFTYMLIAAGIVNLRILFRNFGLWEDMNEMASRMGAAPMPLPPDDLMKMVKDAEKMAGQNANNTGRRWSDGAKRLPMPRYRLHMKTCVARLSQVAKELPTHGTDWNHGANGGVCQTTRLYFCQNKTSIKTPVCFGAVVRVSSRKTPDLPPILRWPVFGSEVFYHEMPCMIYHTFDSAAGWGLPICHLTVC